ECGELTHRTTSIASINTKRIYEDTEVIMKSIPDSEVVGIVFNMSQSNASIKIMGKNNLIKILANAYTDYNRALWLVAWSLIAKVTVPDNGEIKILCDPMWEYLNYEQHDHGRLRPEMVN